MSNLHQPISDVSAQKATAAASYGASISTAAGGAFTVNELALWGGLLLAFLTFIVNWAYQARKEAREAELTRLETELTKARLARVTESSQDDGDD